MKKLITIFLSALILLFVFVFTGCEKSSDTEYGVIEIEIISPVEGDSLTVGDSITVVSKLTGFTFEYSAVNYYFGSSLTPAGIFTKEMLNDLALEQEKDAEFEFTITTDGLSEGEVILRVEAVGNNQTSFSDEVTISAVLPTSDDSSLDFVITSPTSGQQFNIGDRIAVQIEIKGNYTLFEEIKAYLNSSSSVIYESDILDTIKTFDIITEGFAAGTYRMTVDLQLKIGEPKIKYIDFNLVEFIPTFSIQGAADGYQLKSLIQTYDNGYLAVMSYAPTNTTGGTRVIKYDKFGAIVWTQPIPASKGFAESVCEDTEYDKGYVLAGWRWNGTDNDTWVMKINSDNGSQIWYKTYGYSGVNDGATAIKKSVDDGYIVGGYTLNIYGTNLIDGLLFPGVTWETGYDVRLLKIYSNGNEVWGHNVGYIGQRMWHDISLHKLEDTLWIRKMGDQKITDLIVKEDGNYYITGSNNWKYYGAGIETDVFFAEVDNFGGFISTMTWSRMSAFDITHMATEDDDPTGVLNVTVTGANHLGDLTENEAGYGFVESQGGFGGQVVIAGETHQTDSKARLYDGWVLEFGISADEDGALWEYSFGTTAADDKALGISQTRDGGYIVTGYNTNGTDVDTWLYKLDSALGLLWEKKLGVVGVADSGVKVLQCTDGGFIVGGNVGTGATARAKLIKLNKTGDIAK